MSQKYIEEKYGKIFQNKQANPVHLLLSKAYFALVIKLFDICCSLIFLP
jgi:hypothetical protein